MSSEEAAAETKPEAETKPTEDVKTSEDVDKAAEALEKVGVAGESRPDPALFLFPWICCECCSIACTPVQSPSPFLPEADRNPPVDP